MANETPKNKELTVLLRISDLIQSPYQSRFEAPKVRQFTSKGLERKNKAKVSKDGIDELMNSIKESGLMQPIIVRTLENGYEIIDGHRRVEAMKRLDRGQIMAIIKNVDDREAQILHVVGNLQRKNLKPVELALTYQKMLDTGVFKDKREMSKAIGKDETFIGDLLSTLQLDKRIIEDLAKNNLIKDLRILRLIRLYAAVDDNGVSNKQWELYRKVLFTKMSRKELATLVKKPSGNQTLKGWKVKSSSKKFTISIDTGILDQAKKDKLMQLITDKMNEISGSI